MSWNSSAVVDPLLSVEKIATKPSEPSEDEFDLLAPLPKDYGMEQAPAKSLTDWSVGEGTTKDAQNRAPDRSWLSSRQAKIDPLLSVEKVATAKSLTDWSVGEGTTKDAQNRVPGRSWLSRRQAKIDPLLSVEKVATKPSEPSEDKFDLLSPQDYGMDQDRAINSPAKSLTHWSIGEGTTKDAQNRARGRAWPSSWLSRRQTNLLLFLGLVMAALFMYVHYLRETIDILLDITEVDVGFDNGAIQANLTISSQFLPGESAKDPVWASILGGGGAVSLRRYVTHSANFKSNHICSEFHVGVLKGLMKGTPCTSECCTAKYLRELLTIDQATCRETERSIR
jgi:hypothetical protein